MRAQLSLAVVLVSAFAAADENALVGKWESVGRSDVGIGSTLQLNADGSLSRTLGAMVDYTYTVNGGKLKTVYVDPDTRKSKTTTTTIRIEADTLIQKNGDGRGNDVRMTRLTSGDPAHPIVGTWKYAHYTGATAFVTFTGDGREFLRIPLRVDGGSWVAVGNQLSLRVDGTDPVTATYRVDRNMLTLAEGGKEFRYRRVRY